MSSPLRPPGVDLHVHTSASDGTLSPAEVVRMAAELPLQALAIVDHDTTEGLTEAMEAAKAYPELEFIPGVELSSWLELPDGQGMDIHMLGYYVDIGNETFQAGLSELRTNRQRRNGRMVALLAEKGILLSVEQLQQMGPSAGRAHVARLLVEGGHARDIDDAFGRYLGPGGSVYVPRTEWCPDRAIGLICAAGGVPVLAHPRYINLCMKTMEAWLGRWKHSGLKGMEAYYAANAPWETRRYVEMARRMGLICTAGTDFHGSTKPRIGLGVGNGSFYGCPSCWRQLRRIAGLECRAGGACPENS